MFTLRQIAIAKSQKPYHIGPLFTYKNSDLVMKELFIVDNVYKGFHFIYHSSQDCHTYIDHDAWTAYCRSSSDDSVNLLSRTICTTMLVDDWCITNLAHGLHY